MTRSISFARLAAANVPVLNPRSVFVVFINEVTNASRRVITWPHDPRVSSFSSRRHSRKETKKERKKESKKWKKHTKKKRKKAQRSGHPRGIIHRGGHRPGTRPIRPTKKLPTGRGGGPSCPLPGAQRELRASREIRLERLFSWLQLSHLAAIVCRSAQNSAPTVRIRGHKARVCVHPLARLVLYQLATNTAIPDDKSRASLPGLGVNRVQ